MHLIDEYWRQRHNGADKRLSILRFVNTLRAVRQGLPRPMHGRMWEGGYVKVPRGPRLITPEEHRVLPDEAQR